MDSSNPIVRKSRTQDLTGRHFGRWTVGAFAGYHSKTTAAMWHCKCECGVTRPIKANQLLTGGSKSCGCFSVDTARALFTKHGGSYDGRYEVWANMKQRCLNANHPSFAQYGGRGIRICERWLAYENFAMDVGERPNGLWLERINNDGDYEPGNVTWTTRQKQQCNRTDTRRVTWQGETLCINEWSRLIGVSPSTLTWRLKHWNIEYAMTQPPTGRRLCLR